MGVETLMYLCMSILSTEAMPVEKMYSRAINCTHLAELSVDYGHDPLMVIAIAHTESRFNKDAVSKAGARGMLQVIPKYFCPKSGLCDYTRAGLEAWGRWKSRYRNLRDSLCGYNSGRRCKKNHRSSGYANLVLRKYRHLKSIN